METYRFYMNVIHSCTTQDHLQTCIEWVNTSAPSIMRQDLLDLIRDKARSLMNQQ